MTKGTDSDKSDLLARDAQEVLGNLGIDRRTLVKLLGMGTTTAGVGGVATADQHTENGGTDLDGSTNGDHGIHPQFGLPVPDAGNLPDGLSPDHVVELHVEEASEDPLHPPLFHFDPVGLCVEPGDVVMFVFTTPDHTITAYHNAHGFQQRVPPKVPPFSSPVVNAGGAWLYKFTKPGLYDFYCAPHHVLGMAGRIFAGDPEEVGVPDYEDTFEGAQGPPPLLAPFSEAFLERELNHFSESNGDCEWPWLTPQEVLDADVLDPANICDGDGTIPFDELVSDLDRFGDHEDPDEDGSPLEVTVSCEGDNPAIVRITNAGDDPVEARDIDDAGMDVIDGRPVVDPGETMTLTGVGDGTVVLQAYEPGTESENVGPRVEVTTNCG